MSRTTARPVATAILASLFIGVVVGIVWLIIAPRPELVARSGRLTDAVSYPQAYIGADAWLGLLCAAAGFGLAVVGFVRWYPRTPDAALVGLAIGGIVGSLVAWRLGVAIGGEPVAVPAEGVVVAGPLELRSYGVLLFWPTWVAIVGLGVGVSRRRKHRREHAASPSATCATPAGQS